jgi:hypothetical protein
LKTGPSSFFGVSGWTELLSGTVAAGWAISYRLLCNHSGVS